MIAVPFISHKIVSDFICNYVVATFEVPECYKFEKLQRADLGREWYEGTLSKADVYIFGYFSHKTDCICDGKKNILVEQEDKSALPWQFTIKRPIFFPPTE